MPSSAKQLPAFTLVEVLISVAIVAMLSGMMFFNYSRERTRGYLKTAIQQLQTDLQTQQTNAQGGVLVGTEVQQGYGIHFDLSSNTTYALFASPPPNVTYGDASDHALNQRSWPPSVGVQVFKLQQGTTEYNTADVTYTVPNAKAIITASNGGPGVLLTDLRIMLKNTSLNTCYAVTVTANVGTVSARQLTSCT